jgi:hypothetical protein
MWGLADRALELIERRWKLVVLLAWLVFCVEAAWNHRADILLFNLTDSDDNMRLAQVRDLLNGQAWYDLRQHRVNPPVGANIHWSRLVDLPIAGLIAALRQFVDPSHAERLAVAIAPLIPLLLLLFALSLSVRWLISPKAYPLVFPALYFAVATKEMFMPERIDHHGWQLALLALSISAIADPKRVRGGVTLGISTALSLAIGLEMILYLALAGGAVALFWTADAEEKDRLRAYALSLGVASAVCFALFASYDNRQPVCDALSPVWLSDALLGGALLYAVTFASPRNARTRVLIVAAAAAVLALFHAAMWPQCLRGFEPVSPDAQRLWFSHIMEVQPVYERSWPIAVMLSTISITGLMGWGLLAWVRRNDTPQIRAVIAAGAIALCATLLMLWETRTGPAAQMLATIGCAALVWIVVGKLWRLHSDFLSVFGSIAVIVIGSGATAPIALSLLPLPMPSEDELVSARADATCLSLWAMSNLNSQPPGLVITYVDYGPRLIALTHHDAVAAPYHRNSEQIVDVLNFWRGSEQQAHAIAAKYHANYVLTCPNSMAASVFQLEEPDGFSQQLQRQQVPTWLAPLPLPASSPFKMWKVVG